MIICLGADEMTKKLTITILHQYYISITSDEADEAGSDFKGTNC
jgi:hypothetical protein